VQARGQVLVDDDVHFNAVSTSEIDMFKNTIAALAATTTLATSGLALADTDAADRKILSGNFCQDEYQKVGYWRGRVSNKSNTTAYVECPIVRDIVITGGELTSAQARVIDQSPTEAVSCTLWSQDGNSINGWGLMSTRRTSISGYGDATLALVFESHAALGSFGYYSMDCNLPAANGDDHSSVLAYTITER
jgi:hypothetical protein